MNASARFAGRRLAAGDAARIFASTALCVALVAPSIVRTALPDVAPLGAPFGSCPTGARRVADRIVCGSLAGEPLDERASLLLGKPIDVNVADAETLALVPGIGEKLSERIVVDRASHGPFRSMEDLQRVDGIGPRLASTLARWARVFDGTLR